MEYLFDEIMNDKNINKTFRSLFETPKTKKKGERK